MNRIILRVKRRFYIQQNAIFEAAIIAYAKTLPSPVLSDPKEGEALIGWENSASMIRIRDKFMSYVQFKRPLWEAFWKILICKPDCDPIYQDCGQFILEEVIESVLNGEWKPRAANNPPPSLWKEPHPYGSFQGRNFKQFIKGGDQWH